MKFAIIEGGKVVNIAVADAPLADNWIEAGAAAIGWAYADGVFTPPPVPEPPVPEIVSRFQARAALYIAGRLADAEAAVAASNDPLTQLAWAEAVEWKRSSPALNALAGAIGMTQADVDELFRTAASIEA
jgi:hypothetical protein